MKRRRYHSTAQSSYMPSCKFVNQKREDIQSLPLPRYAQIRGDDYAAPKLQKIFHYRKFLLPRLLKFTARLQAPSE